MSFACLVRLLLLKGARQQLRAWWAEALRHQDTEGTKAPRPRSSIAAYRPPESPAAFSASAFFLSVGLIGILACSFAMGTLYTFITVLTIH
ncbi:UNVERIFIED_CONTAM: hypothetical protein FKN15_016195 [Acipenser sinensis]